jgi:hypothetical protein
MQRTRDTTLRITHCLFVCFLAPWSVASGRSVGNTVYLPALAKTTFPGLNLFVLLYPQTQQYEIQVGLTYPIA